MLSERENGIEPTGNPPTEADTVPESCAAQGRIHASIETQQTESRLAAEDRGWKRVIQHSKAEISLCAHVRVQAGRQFQVDGNVPSSLSRAMRTSPAAETDVW
jgi:hypothetical protein